MIGIPRRLVFAPNSPSPSRSSGSGSGGRKKGSPPSPVSTVRSYASIPSNYSSHSSPEARRCLILPHSTSKSSPATALFTSKSDDDTDMNPLSSTTTSETKSEAPSVEISEKTKYNSTTIKENSQKEKENEPSDAADGLYYLVAIVVLVLMVLWWYMSTQILVILSTIVTPTPTPTKELVGNCIKFNMEACQQLVTSAKYFIIKHMGE